MRDTPGAYYSERLPDGRTAVFRGRRPRRPRERQARWDAENMATVATRVSIRTARRFHRLCHERGRTAYSVLREFVENEVKRGNGGD